MAIIKRTDEFKQLKDELSVRYDKLRGLLETRPLKSAKEGVGAKSCWRNPDKMSAIDATETELRMAVADFQTILKEVGRLK